MNPLYNGWIRPAPAERPRVAEAGAVAGEPARVGRALGAGRGGPARQDPGRGSEAPRPRRPPRRPPRVRLRPPDPQRRHVRRRPPPQAPRQPLRSVGPQGPARRRDRGRDRCWRRSRASRSTTTRSRRWSAVLGSTQRGRSRSTGPGSTGRSASSPSSTPLATSRTTPTSPGSRRSGRRRDELVEGIGGRGPGTARDRVAPGPRRVSPAGRRTEGEGRPDARHLRADRGRGTRDRRRFASRRRPTRTDWRWRCPKRLQWRARQDSNLRPSAPEADALSTELQAREPRSYRSSVGRASASCSRCIRGLFRVQSAHLMSRRA